MKAIVLEKMTGPNPAWNRRAADAAKARGEEYDIPRFVTFAPGDEIDHPDVHILCCKSPPTCRPADDECREAVHKFFNSPGRKRRLVQLKRMAQPAVFKTLPEELQEYVREAMPKYRNELEQLEEATTDEEQLPQTGAPFPVDGDEVDAGTELSDFVDDDEEDGDDELDLDVADAE